MLLFHNCYENKNVSVSCIADKLKVFNNTSTDDHQYNLILFEHIFGFKLLDDVSLINQFIKIKHLLYKDMICYDAYLDLYNLNKTNEKSNFEWYSLITYTKTNLADILFAEYRTNCAVNKIYKNNKIYEINKRNWYVFVYN